MLLRTDWHTAGARSDTLIVLLPPSLSSLDDFYQHGLVDALRQRQIPADLLLADVTAQHVMNRTVVTELHTQVVQPAQAQGYQRIWLMGISMGAFCALHYVAAHAPGLAGLCLLAPYPGTHDVLAEIRAAGGALAWAGTQTGPGQDERAWWYWLGQQAHVGEWPTPVYLASGQSDRFLSGQKLLAELLPPGHTQLLHGGHDWPTWKSLWEQWLDFGPLAAQQAVQAAGLQQAPPTMGQP